MSGMDQWRRARDRVLQPVTEAERETLERVLEVLHEARHIDSVATASASILSQLNHEIVTQRDEPERIAGDTRDHLDARVRHLTGRLVDLASTISAPARDAAFAATIALHPAPDERVEGCSVLIPTWNHAVHLDAAIDVACQVTDPEHVVVLDDASDDETAELLAARSEPIQVIRAVGNLRLTRARNVLIHVCPTRHALVLDADNSVDPEAIRTLYSMAVEWDAAVAHGVLVEGDSEGTPSGLLSARPLDGEFFTIRHNVVDTLSVVDVDRVRAVGGYTLDPVLDTAEDWDMWHRLASTGALLLHVPIVAGRKLVVPQGYNSIEPQDGDQKFARLDRQYRYGGRLDDRSVASAVIHPLIGPLWASAAAVERHPSLADDLGEVHHDARLPVPATPKPLNTSVLVVGSGGVRNLGDDVVTTESIRRLRSVLPPSVAIEVVTDGARPLLQLDGATWIGTLEEHAERPLRDHQAVMFGGGGTLADPFESQSRLRADIAVEAERVGIPLILSGQGLDGIHAIEDSVRQIMTRSAAVSCRDELSATRARALGAQNVSMIGDDASHSHGPSIEDLPSRLRGLDARGWLVFHARFAGYSAYDRDALHAWSRLVDEAAIADDLPVVAVVQNGQPDSEFEALDEILPGKRAAWTVVDCTDDPGTARTVYGLARAGVVVSYHAAWFALEGGAPALFPTGGAYYESKSAGMRALTGVGSSLDDATPPTDLAGLRARWEAVADQLRPELLRAVDERATEWLRDALTGAGVPVLGSR